MSLNPQKNCIRKPGLAQIQATNSSRLPSTKICLQYLILYIVFFPGLNISVSYAQSDLNPAGKTAPITRTGLAPTIDGRLDEVAWKQARPIDDFHQIQPTEYAEPTEQTEVYLLYDDDALYIGARLHESEPDGVTARVLRQGDSVRFDDWFSVVLDPFNNRRDGYWFLINPHGVRQQALFQNTSQVQFDWTGIFQAAATYDENGWIAEIAIPLKTISFDPSADSWGINFQRNIARKRESVGWVSRNRSQNPSIVGQVTGFDNLRQGLGLDVVPSINLTRERIIEPSSNTSSANPSLDVFYKLTPTLNASLTINTDFSATEVDDRQVNLTRFGLFFPEKRDFFLQDADIFAFGGIEQRIFGPNSTATTRPLTENGRPFFSRRIGLGPAGQPVDIEYGGKLSGRIGRWNLGTLFVQQEALGDLASSQLFVGRASANVLRESSVGIILTDGDPRTNLDNSVLGLDFRYRNSRLPRGRTLEGEAWYQHSETEGLDGDDGAFGLQLRMPNNTGWRGGIGLKELGANFNPALGFINRRDIRDYTSDLGYTLRPSIGAFRSIFFGIDAERIELLTGRLQSQVISVRPLELETHAGNLFNFRHVATKESINDSFEIAPGLVISPGHYSFNGTMIELQTGGQRRLSGRVVYHDGDFFDGGRQGLLATITWRPTEHFRGHISYDINDIELPQGDFVTRLVRVQFDIAFSSKLSWVNLIQYDNVSEIAGINSQLQWVPEAGKEAFFVINHNLADIDKDNRFNSARSDLTAKFTYTFRF